MSALEFVLDKAGKLHCFVSLLAADKVACCLRSPLCTGILKITLLPNLLESVSMLRQMGTLVPDWECLSAKHSCTCSRRKVCTSASLQLRAIAAWRRHSDVLPHLIVILLECAASGTCTATVCSFVGWLEVCFDCQRFVQGP